MQQTKLLFRTIITVLALSASSLGFAQGDFWQKTNGPGGSIQDLAVSNSGTIFAGKGGSQGGLYRSTDNGENWSGVILQGIILHVTASDNSGTIFAGPAGAGLFRSTDNGDNWTQTSIDTPLTVRAFGFVSSGDLFSGAYSNLGNPDDGLYRSSDNGENWSRISTHKVDALAVNNNGDIFAGTGGPGMFRSSDNGDNWTEINTGLTNTNIADLVINSTDDIFAATTGGIFRSTDNGDNWIIVYTNLSNPVNSLAMNSDNDIFAGLNGGPRILRSSDNGDNWSEISTGLSGSTVDALTINSNDIIFAGNGNGVFRSIEPTTSVEQIATTIPTSFSLEQNYPNPFNPSTTIQFAVASQAKVRVIVFDVSGREVATLVDERLPPGVYKVIFEGSDLANGVYFYRLDAGEFSQTKKLTLLK